MESHATATVDGQTSGIPPQIELYAREAPTTLPYEVRPHHRFTEDERTELAHALAVTTSPYQDYPGYLAEIQRLVRAGQIPAFFREACTALKEKDVREEPIFYFKNCPTGEVPLLDFDDPVASKYARKKDFIAEAFLSVFAELYGTPIVTYRTANNGDMFHDVHPLRNLQFSKSQKSLHTLHFHTDLPDNRVRPDWVNLLCMRNSPENEVYNAFVRLRDVFATLDDELRATLEKPLFHAPKTIVKNNISVYGLGEVGYLAWKPIIVKDRGYEYLCYNESYTESESEEGKHALAALSLKLQHIRHSFFFEERDFVAMCNHTSMHARHVVKLNDLDAHQHRWVLKTWNVENLDPHRPHFVPGRINTADE
jgi:hypothetical protein